VAWPRNAFENVHAFERAPRERVAIPEPEDRTEFVPGVAQRGNERRENERVADPICPDDENPTGHRDDARRAARSSST
jgi:hypothetical protein